MQGQVLRCRNLLSEMNQQQPAALEIDIRSKPAHRVQRPKISPEEGLVSTNMGHSKGKVLTMGEARKHKVDMDLHSRKQQKLLQATA